MLPSSGACALSTNGPMPVRPASAETNAIAVIDKSEPAPLRRHVREPHAPLLCLLAQLDDHRDHRASLGFVAHARVGAELRLGRAHHLVHELADLQSGVFDVGRQREVDAHGRQSAGAEPCLVGSTEWRPSSIEVCRKTPQIELVRDHFSIS